MCQSPFLRVHMLLSRCGFSACWHHRLSFSHHLWHFPEALTQLGSGCSRRKTMTKEVVVKAKMFFSLEREFKFFRNLKAAAIYCLCIFDWWVKVQYYSILWHACGWSTVIRKMHFPQPEPAFLECRGWLAVLWVGKFYSPRQLCDLACFSQQIHSSCCRHLLTSFSFLP